MQDDTVHDTVCQGQNDAHYDMALQKLIAEKMTYHEVSYISFQ
jgi:hypothetical protein